MKVFKILCGILLVFVLGFFVFLCLSGLGFVVALTFSTMSVGQIAVGTMVGTVMALLWLLNWIDKEIKDEN